MLVTEICTILLKDAHTYVQAILPLDPNSGEAINHSQEDNVPHVHSNIVNSKAWKCPKIPLTE